MSAPAQLAALTAALESLNYLSLWADLDAAERSSLAHAQRLLRALRDDLSNASATSATITTTTTTGGTT